MGSGCRAVASKLPPAPGEIKNKLPSHIPFQFPKVIYTNMFRSTINEGKGIAGLPALAANASVNSTELHLHLFGGCYIVVTSQ